MEGASTGAEGKVIGRGVQGCLLEPCWGRANPCVQLDLIAADLVMQPICAVEGVCAGTWQKVPRQVLHTYSQWQVAAAIVNTVIHCQHQIEAQVQGHIGSSYSGNVDS